MSTYDSYSSEDPAPRRTRSATAAKSPPPPSYEASARTGGGRGGSTALRAERERLAALHELMLELEISAVAANELLLLREYDIVFLCDDSGSMQTMDGHGRVSGVVVSRWDELKDTVEKVIRVAACLDDDGIDLYFLNREGANNVTSFEEAAPCFVAPPRGYTPLADRFSDVVAQHGEGKPLLVVIATDGAPTTKVGNRDVAGFVSALRKRNTREVRVSILACTDDDAEVGYLDGIDDKVDGVDVTDDYAAEALQIKKATGKPFTRGDWIAKMLLGPILAHWDQMDEKPAKACCCVL